MSATVPCKTMFSNGMEFEWFIEHNCERCTRFRGGNCKVYRACQLARWDETKFPYDNLLDFADGYAGKACRLFTDEPMKRQRREKQISGQITFEGGTKP